MIPVPAQSYDHQAALVTSGERRGAGSALAQDPASTDVGRRRTGLRLQLTRPRRDLAVLTAAGDIDSSNAAELGALLWPALLVERSSIVLDFTAVTFLGVAGLELLSAANTYAPHRGLRIVLLAGQPAVERAVRAGSPDVALHREPHLAACTTTITSTPIGKRVFAGQAL